MSTQKKYQVRMIIEEVEIQGIYTYMNGEVHGLDMDMYDTKDAAMMRLECYSDLISGYNCAEDGLITEPFMEVQGDE